MAMIKEIELLLMLDWQTILVLIVLCSFAAYFIKEYLAIPTMIVFVYPVLLFFSLAAQRVFLALEAYPPKKLDAWLMWTIMAAILGNIVGTCVVASLARLRELSGRSATPRIETPPPRRT
jgi:hypothetical protein